MVSLLDSLGSSIKQFQQPITLFFPYLSPFSFSPISLPALTVYSLIQYNLFSLTLSKNFPLFPPLVPSTPIRSPFPTIPSSPRHSPESNPISSCSSTTSFPNSDYSPRSFRSFTLLNHLRIDRIQDDQRLSRSV